MHFDFLSFFLGLITAGSVAWVFDWSEKCSEANRIAYNLLLEARQTINTKRLRRRIEKPHLYTDEYLDQQIGNPDFDPDEGVYPFEDERFLILVVPDYWYQTDVSIHEYIGVYSKHYHLWFLIEESYNCEDMTSRFMYYLSDSAFNQGAMIKTPYDFNIGQYLSKKTSTHWRKEKGAEETQP